MIDINDFFTSLSMDEIPDKAYNLDDLALMLSTKCPAEDLGKFLNDFINNCISYRSYGDWNVIIEPMTKTFADMANKKL